MTWREISVVSVYCIASVVAVATFIAALRSEETVANPSGEAGLYAPVIALSVATMLLAEVFGVDSRISRRWRAVGIGIGSWLSAYLWMADGAKVHPSNLILLFDLSMLWILAAIVSFALVPWIIGVILIYRRLR